MASAARRPLHAYRHVGSRCCVFIERLTGPRSRPGAGCGGNRTLTATTDSDQAGRCGEYPFGRIWAGKFCSLTNYPKPDRNPCTQRRSGSDVSNPT